MNTESTDDVMNDYFPSNYKHERRRDFRVSRGSLDLKNSEEANLRDLVYMDVLVGDDGITGWVRPEVRQRIMSTFENSPANAASSSDVRQSWTNAELRDAALRFMLAVDGKPKEMDEEQRARWHTNLGLLTNFINCLWTNSFE